jgi:hypothetical protein
MSSTPYFTSRQRSSYTRPSPSVQAAAHGNKNELLRALVGLGARMTQLETRVGGGSIDLASNSPVSTPPPAAEFNVSSQPGVFIIQATNPQFKQNPGNLPHTPIQHKFRFSSTQNFSTSDTLPIGPQTYYEVSKYGTGVRKWIEASSSYDGKTFNSPQIFGPLTA